MAKKKMEPSLGPTRVIAYIRVSTSQQADEGSSLAAQKAKIEAYTSAFGLELVGVEVDAGESASSLDRPGLQRALGALDDGRASALLVVKLDRLTRSVRDFYTLADTYFKEGMHALLSVSENIDTRTAMGRMVLGILVSVSQWEREAAAERTVAVKKHLRDSGAYAGGWPPYGHALDEDGNLIECPVERTIMLQARALREGGMSLRAVAAALPLNARTGKIFNASQIARMM